MKTTKTLKGEATRLECSIEIAVPARTAYDQWTQFETWPRIVQGLDAVRQTDERHLSWKGTLAGRKREGEIELCEQIPDKRIAWRSLAGFENAGVVTFHRLTDQRCKVMLQVDYLPEGLLENLGDAIGLGRQRVEHFLQQMRSFLETRGQATGAWRGSIPSVDERPARGPHA